MTVNVNVNYNGKFYRASLKHDTETDETEIDVFDHEVNNYIDVDSGCGKKIADNLIKTYLK